ncbi:FHA domain-containing protein [Nocardia vinacea]|uniref:FHA domain-containing protein n=1 Tax=Nocardia vinacea TaxID=96468 RepID=UPI0002F6DD53|nr:FHA domain-containing protein [Nocardia vinacea]
MAIATCPDGHQSVATDYCDVCGSPIGAPAPTIAAALCPSCGSPSTGRFCEVCGADSALPTPVPRAAAPTEIVTATAVSDAEVASVAGAVTWVATITADREFYDRVQARKGPDADQVEFPAFYPERRIMLRGTDILIGKHSVSQGLQPEIDLGIAPADAGVSRAHAIIRLTETGITITDLGSTNGTSLNGSEDLIPAEAPVQLQSGDRIHLGGWTTIIVTAENR